MKFITIVTLLVLGESYSLQHGNNTVCPSLTRYDYPKTIPLGVTFQLDFLHPVLMQKLYIDTTGCYEERELIEGSFSLNFVDASDASYEDRDFPEVLWGTWDQADNIIGIPMSSVVYTKQVALTSHIPIHCSRVYVHGCTTDEICQPDTCKNGGTCIGNGNCACPDGFVGDDCSESIADIKLDNYDIVAAAAGLLFTTDAPFEIDGDVSFNINGRKAKRTFFGYHHGGYHHSYGYHGNSMSFHGNGGSCHYSHSHSSGYSNGHHSTYGHSSSSSSYSSMHGGQSYSHSCQHSFGYGHNHNSHHYLYSTHGSNHYSQGASCHYHNHHLHVHVHDHHNNCHYHATAPYTPKPNQVNTITTSYARQAGVTIIINGQVVSQQTTPTPVPPVTTTTTTTTTKAPTNIPTGLCFGLCGLVNNRYSMNCTMSNMMVAGAHISSLIQNNLAGILGPQIANFLLNQLLPRVHNQATTTLPPPTTRKPPTVATQAHTTAATFAPMTAAPTRAPTIPPPTTPSTHPNLPLATATSIKTTSTTTQQTTTTVTTTQATTTTPLPKVSATTAIHGPICHDCLRMDQNGNCSNAMQCSYGDVCLAMHDRFGYTYRCISKDDCDHGTLKATADCWNCCTKNLCNDKCIGGGNTSTCQDDAQCASLRSLGSFYDVCADPALSTTACILTCNNCP
ncbi:cd59 glycoprotein-like [Mactra antiquata]